MRLQDLPGYSHVLSLFTCRIYPKRFRAAIGLRLIRELCLWLTLPAAGRIRVFHPLERALTGRTERGLHLVFQVGGPAFVFYGLFPVISGEDVGNTAAKNKQPLGKSQNLFVIHVYRIPKAGICSSAIRAVFCALQLMSSSPNRFRTLQKNGRMPS